MIGVNKSREEHIRKIVETNPTGIIVIHTPSSVQAMFWTDRNASTADLFRNFLTGIAQQAIDKGVMTKQNVIETMEVILKQRIVT